MRLASRAICEAQRLRETSQAVSNHVPFELPSSSEALGGSTGFSQDPGRGDEFLELFRACECHRTWKHPGSSRHVLTPGVEGTPDTRKMGVCQPAFHRSPQNLKEERYILVYGFRDFRPWLLVLLVLACDAAEPSWQKTWQQRVDPWQPGSRESTCHGRGALKAHDQLPCGPSLLKARQL